jgi:site-specific recombinase XerD
MKEVDPIEDLADVGRMYKFMMKNGHVREAHAFIIGCNVALRVSDLFSLTFEQLEQSKANLTEMKTGKNKTLTFNDTVFNHVELLMDWYKSQYVLPTYLFESTSKNTKKVQPISASWMNRIISEAGEAVMLDYNVGTHTMRKTFCYHAYKNGMDIRQIQKMLNHSSSAITLAYIGITKRTIAQAYHDNAISVL